MKEDSYGRMYDTKIPKERYRTNSNGEIEGLYILYKEDGKNIQQKITYKNGKKDGPAYLGWASGNYKNDLEEGEWIEHYLGENITVINYIQGVVVGKKITYSDKSRTKILSFTEYQNGVPNGKHASYFEDGNIKEEGNYLNGAKNGYWVEYGPDLVTSEYIFSKGNYINGNRDGEWINYGKCYAYLGAYGKQYSYVPKQTENSYIEFTLGSESAFGPKKGYNAVYNNGKYIKDEDLISAYLRHIRDSIDIVIKKEEEDRLKAYQREQDSIRMAKEKVENDYIQMINGVKSKPYTETERNFAGSWEFKSEKIYAADGIFIFFEEFKVQLDRTYIYKSYFKKWLETQIYKEYNEKGIWEIKDNTFYAYINEEDGKPSKRIDPLKFDEISKKKAIRTVEIFTDIPPVKLTGKKVAEPVGF